MRLIVWGCSFLEANCPSNSLLERLLSFERSQWKPIEAIPIKLKLQRDNIVWKWRTTQPTKDARLRFFLTLFEIQICQFWEKSHLSLVWNDGSFSSFLYLVSGMIGGEGNVFLPILGLKYHKRDTIFYLHMLAGTWIIGHCTLLLRKVFCIFSLLPAFLKLGLSTAHLLTDWLLDWSSPAKWA